MEMVNLVDFVKSWEIFEKIEWYYDRIVSDFDFWNLEWFIKINNISDLNNIDKSKKILFILDKLLYDNIVNFFDMKEICILDMNFWINSFGNKLSISNTDIVKLLDYNIDIYEPCDLISFLNYLELDGKCYVRINKNDLPLNFSDDSQVKDFIDMTSRWFDWESMTVVTTWSMLPEVIRTNHLLNENGIFPGIFILNKLNADLNDIDFKSKNIVFIIDIFQSDFYELFINNKFKDFNIKFIYPNYSKITSILDEYRFQDLLFDAESLYFIIKNN